MDNSIVSAGVSTKQRQQQLRKAMPYPVTKYDSKIKKPPVAMPKTTVKQLQLRAKAELASQGGFPSKSDANVDPNLLQNEQGILIARQKAATDVNFDAHAAKARNIENMLARNEKINYERDARDATAEVMQMGLSLGSAHGELLPQDREAMDKRLQQLRSLVGSRTIEAQMRAGNRLQAGYALDTRRRQAEEANALHARRFIDRQVERGSIDVGMWYGLDDGEHSSYRSGTTPHYSERSSGKGRGKGGIPSGSTPFHAARAAFPSLFGSTSSGRSGVDVGFLPARK